MYINVYIYNICMWVRWRFGGGGVARGAGRGHAAEEVRRTHHAMSPYSKRDCAKTLRSSYTGLYSQIPTLTSGPNRPISGVRFTLTASTPQDASARINFWLQAPMQ